MTIFSPGLGDLLDRLIILERKIQQERRLHWTEEREAILKQLPTEFNLQQVWEIIRLAVTNMTLWQETDEQSLAQRLMKHNDQRHLSVEYLNDDERKEKL